MSEKNSGRGRKRSRSRNRGKASSNNPVGTQAKQQRGRGKATPKVDPTEFWGNPELLPEPGGPVAHAPDVQAVLTSLGRPPITGQETAAEHWFTLVYERAAFLAGALAAAGGLGEDDAQTTAAADPE